MSATGSPSDRRSSGSPGPGLPSDTIAEAQRSIVDAFRGLEDWTERYRFLIDLGRRLPPLPPEQCVEDNRLPGCQAQVWLVSEQAEGVLVFRAASDAAIVAGLIALLLKVYSGRTPREILATEPAFIDTIGLASHLSPNRANGLGMMYRRIREIASHSLALEAQP
ncbi:MAG: SufE family protein [Steroidobacteraceae bacterium]|jgi:cysteine desulfuration protein SufE|nr:SufE family protein [Steroidobacteraceae bacterium]